MTYTHCKQLIIPLKIIFSNQLIRIVTASALILLNVGCGSKPALSPSSEKADSKRDLNTAFNSIAHKRQSINKLDLFFQHWVGVPYVIGGLSRAGVDCSGWVYMAYAKAFGKRLPRTTAQQVKTGNWVSRSHLQYGDLVFFKTGVKIRHVGIYIGDDKFMHASTSVGVTVSKLSNPYWHSRYWMARRHKF